MLGKIVDEQPVFCEKNFNNKDIQAQGDKEVHLSSHGCATKKTEFGGSSLASEANNTCVGKL